jgi:hypothetical protein
MQPVKPNLRAKKRSELSGSRKREEIEQLRSRYTAQVSHDAAELCEGGFEIFTDFPPDNFGLGAIVLAQIN